jgi:hypothetical protein
MNTTDVQNALSGGGKFDIHLRGRSDALAILPSTKFSVAGNVLIIPQDPANKAFETLTVNIEDIVMISKRRS